MSSKTRAKEESPVPTLLTPSGLNDIEILCQTVTIPGLSETHANTVLIQLADLHVAAHPDDVTTVSICIALAHRLRATLTGLGASPEKTVMMIGGDLVCKAKHPGDPETSLDTLQQALEPLAQIPTALTVVVEGNHDAMHTQASDIWQICAELGMLPMGLVDTGNFFLDHPALPGMLVATPDFKSNPEFYASTEWDSVKAELAKYSATELLFWLTHNIRSLDAPLLATLAADGGAVFSFSGHTHGRQQTEPTTPYVAGDYTPRQGVNIHVTSGLGDSVTHGRRTARRNMRILRLLAAQ